MTLDTRELQELAAQWSQVRAIYSVFHGIAERYQLETLPCPPLESLINAAEREALVTAEAWLRGMDERIQVHQLRLFLQTSPLPNELTLRSLIRFELQKPPHGAVDRDKLDFLMVQYFAQRAPEALMHTAPGFAEVSQVLQPVLGDVSPEALPPSLAQIADVIRRLARCGSLRNLLEQKLLEEVRNIKAAAQDEYFVPATLIAFTRVNFLTRQTFFRLMHTDVQAIRTGVRILQQRGITHLDGTRAQLSAEEPLARVLEMARQWKKPFLEEYSAGNHFVQLAELRTALEEVLARTAAMPAQMPKPVKEKAVAAGAGSSTVAAAPAALPPSPVAAVPPADIADELRKIRKQLAQYLMRDRARTRTVGATIVIGHSRLALSAWEVTAFVEGVGEFTEVVQRGVAVRVLVFQYLEQARQNGVPGKMAGILAAARTEAHRLQESVTDARDARNIEATVTLSTTAQRLISLIAEAEGLSPKG